MERYKLIKEVGNGAFGTVWQAISKENREVVAVKKMKKKYYSWEECLNLREVKSLRKLNHPNIMKLKEVIRENDVLYFVFEYMDCNLYELMEENGKPFSEDEVRKWSFQIFQALSYMHHCGYFHRDLKPENLLVSNGIIKIADFGLAREISLRPPFTEYVSTRWYRAPEVLLQSCVYDSAVDMWAMGAIIAELLTFSPLFPGSSEADELYKICSVIGTPDWNSWGEGLVLADALMFQFPQVDGVPLSMLIPSASVDAINLISLLCSWDPNKRPTALEALQHPFFKPCFYIPPSVHLRTATGVPSTPPSVGSRGALEQNNGRRYPPRLLPDAKPTTNFSSRRINVPLCTGIEGAKWQLEMNHQEAEKKESFSEDVKLSRYLPPAKRDIQRDLNIADKLGGLTLNSNWVRGTAHEPEPIRKPGRQSHAMRAGGWPNSNDFLARPREIPPARIYHEDCL